MKTSRLRLTFSLICLVISSSFISLSYAVMLKPTTLEQRAGWSKLICEMTITDKRVENDTEAAGRLAVYYTATVHECVKGVASSPFVYKQVLIRDVPQYTVGQRYLLFFPEETDKGYVGPVGFDQGVYSLEKVDGKWTAPSLSRKTFESQAHSLSINLKAARESAPSDDYDSFKATLRKMGEVTP